MEDRIEVSVICNVYNHGRYLRDALDGFIMQKTNFPFEVLIHDDASTDDSAAIIREYEEKYPELIKPIYQTENKYSKNINIDVAYQYPRVNGKYIAFCEGDDYWTDPLKLQKQYDFMESNPEYSMCICSCQWLNMLTGRVENRCQTNEDRDISTEEIILEKKGRVFQFASVFVKTDVGVATPYWLPLFPIGDYPMAIKAALAGKVHMLADVMCVYRWYSSGSWTARMDNDNHRLRVGERMVEGLIALNEATAGKYADLIETRIVKHQYTNALMRHDLDALKNGKLGEKFRKRAFILRVSDVFRCKYPKAYRAVRNITKHFIK